MPVSEEQVAQFKAAYALFDKQGNGIAAKQLGGLMKALGHKLAEDELKDMVNSIGNSKGVVGFDEFLSLLAQSVNDEEVFDADDAIKEAFKAYDPEGSCYVASADFRHVMMSLNPKLTGDEADDLVQEADSEGDGQINYVEFVSGMASC